jgi:hypothetical protein
LALVATFAKFGKQSLLGLAAISNADVDDDDVAKPATKNQDDDGDDDDSDDDHNNVDEPVACVLGDTMRERAVALLNKCVHI